MKFILLFALTTLNAWANSDISKLPPSFNHETGQAVFADWQLATYDIVYDVKTKRSVATATIDLTLVEAGYPIFDVIAEPLSIELDGKPTSATLTQTPNNETRVRVIDQLATAGSHRLKVVVPNSSMIDFTNSGVSQGMWFGDLEDRAYMERFLPANFIFDRVPVVFNIQFIGAGPQTIYSNGKVEDLGNNTYRVKFAEDYNLTCQYFHTVPTGSSVETRFVFKSIDGREVPVVIYRMADGSNQSGYLQSLKLKTLAILNELEKDYGAWPHQDLTVYVTASPTGGMEFSAATITSEKALGHELFHSYFARAVMPSDGSSGWIDEALAKWRDNGYQRLSSLEGSSSLGARGSYNRATDMLAYTFGERFMALLDGDFAEQGGLKPFLRDLMAHRTFDPLNTADFISSMNIFYGAETDELFNRYVLGRGKIKSLRSERRPRSLIHGQWSAKQMEKFL